MVSSTSGAFCRLRYQSGCPCEPPLEATRMTPVELRIGVLRTVSRGSPDVRPTVCRTTTFMPAR